MRTKNGQAYELDCKVGESNDNDEWTNLGSPAGDDVDSRPFGVVYEEDTKHYAKVFVKGSKGNLWELNTLDIESIPDPSEEWESLDTPDQNVKVSANPHGYLENPAEQELTSENKHIFVKGTDDNLWERIDNEWKSLKTHESPSHLKLKFSPYVLHDVNDNIFSASSQNSIIERDINTIKVWNEYKDPVETTLTPALSWEYWNNRGWMALTGVKDTTSHLLHDGKIIFHLPDDIEENEIAGQKSNWIRARLLGGDYGKETYSLDTKTFDIGIEQKLTSTKDTIRPPKIKSLTISYSLESKQSLQQCLTLNNLEYLNQIETCWTEGKHFSPFIQLKQKNKTLYLGFEKTFKGSPVQIFFAARELPFTEEKKQKLEWSYSTGDDWEELDNHDVTEGLIKADILDFMMNTGNFSGLSMFGTHLFWIKGSLTKGEYEEFPVLDGIYPNTAWAFQTETIKDEILGSGNGEPNQDYSFLKIPVLEGKEIKVCEVLSEEEKQDIIASQGKDAVQEVTDDEGKVIETWILWTEVPDFFDSVPYSRHYILDHARGLLRFGDGTYGMIPPSGDNNIKAFWYQTGGGKQGNVQAREIKTLNTTVAGVDGAINHVSADGGADTTTLDQMLEIGPAVISHRNRAVTAEDFEWMALQASRKLARVKCLPNTNNRTIPNYKREREPGWVTMIIIPDSPDDKPYPSLELKRKVKKYLESHCTNTLSSAQHVHVAGPWYVEISVSIDVFVTSIDVASEVERETGRKLRAFFHPLTGGPEEEGWDFGRDVSASDIYAFLEDIKGVDHVENLTFVQDDGSYPDVVEIKPEFLAANGNHLITIQLWKGG